MIVKSAGPLRTILYWLKLGIFIVILVPVAIWIVSTAALVTSITIPLQHPVCCETPARFGAEYESISFITADGLTLRGWYIPPQNGVVIILIHSYYGDRRSVMAPATMLYRHGYGLLMYDQRASGESEGNVRSLGWLDIPDLAVAASWVAARQPGARIGVSGCSIGGAIAIAGAAQTPLINAVAVDAPSPLSWEEYKPVFNPRDLFSSLTLLAYYPLVGLRAGVFPTLGTAEAVQAYSPRPILFFSTGEAGEKDRIVGFYAVATGPKIHVNLPDSGHCAAPYTHPIEYEQRLVNFFDTYLLQK